MATSLGMPPVISSHRGKATLAKTYSKMQRKKVTVARVIKFFSNKLRTPKTQQNDALRRCCFFYKNMAIFVEVYFLFSLNLLLTLIS